MLYSLRAAPYSFTYIAKSQQSLLNTHMQHILIFPMDWKEIKELSKEIVYLMVGNDSFKAYNEKIARMQMHSIDYFLVGGESVIKGSKRYHCSCNYKACWHIISVVLQSSSISDSCTETHTTVSNIPEI